MELGELLSEADDVSDPGAMEKILIYLDELETQDNDFMELLIERLRNETITWEQPWYQQRHCLTRRLDYDNTMEESETFRTDSFTKAETKRMAKNWKKFKKMYNLPDTPICLARWRNRNKSRNRAQSVEEQARHFVIAYLARGLERNLYQVHLHFVAHYGAPSRGLYSKMEERAMEICFLHKPNKAVPILAAILGREARGISKRINFMHKGKQEHKKKKWTLPLATKFMKSLMKHSGMPLEELKNAKLDKAVWLQVQEDMEHDYRYLQYFWQRFLHVQLFVRYDVKLTHLRRKILKLIRSSPYEVWPDIRWKQLLANFPDGFTHMFLYQSVFKLVHKYHVYRQTPLQEVVDFGLTNLKSVRINQNKRLRTLEFNSEGDLVPIRYSEKMP